MRCNNHVSIFKSTRVSAIFSTHTKTNSLSYKIKKNEVNNKY